MAQPGRGELGTVQDSVPLDSQHATRRQSGALVQQNLLHVCHLV